MCTIAPTASDDPFLQLATLYTVSNHSGKLSHFSSLSNLAAYLNKEQYSTAVVAGSLYVLL